MANPFAALARVFSRGSSSPVAAALYSNAIGQPLLVHPQIGESLLGAYMSGAVDARPPTAELVQIEPETRDPIAGARPARNIAVLNVSGALINRPVPGMCDPGPLSYAEIRNAFDMALADDSVEAVVLRLETPGGMVSGCFDLSDHINASRGTKPIYAAVDDYAYSAGYAIASACDEIWLTRTGGVGSVGVIGYHVDQSSMDARIGIKVTAIHSGAHKNDGTPFAPLAEPVRARLQMRMDELRGMFAGAVATYRGLPVDAVLGTEAQVYSGQEAIDIGMADRIGTFRDLIESIAAGPVDPAADVAEGSDVEGDAVPAESGGAKTDAAIATIIETAAASESAIAALAEINAELSEPAAAQEADPPTEAATTPPPDFAAVVAASSLPPSLGMALIRRGQNDQAPDAAIAYAASIRDVCAAAGIESTAAEYVQSNTDLATVRSQLLAAKAAGEAEIVTALPSNAPPGSTSSLNSADVYQRRAQRQ